MKALAAAALFSLPGLCPAAGFSGCPSWPTSMAVVHMMNDGITDSALLDHSKTKATKLAIQKIGKNRWRQLYEITFHEKSGREITVVTENESSSTECSISGVVVRVVSRKLGWLERPEDTQPNAN
ncbi:MAG TPA: hypothetical protein VL689_18795 [Paraburkholderia sp.]|nr:hypothetical protein [Paraburkholderia sp.]